MDEMNHAFKAFKNSTRRETFVVGTEFEEQVFAKIKRKKTVRKHITAAIVGFSLAGFLFLAQSVIFHENPVENKQIIAHGESTQIEEIPLMEDVIFTSSDSQNDYAIEQVVYHSDDDTI
ncbi:MAG: hypothetical protein KAT34_21670 [Candidatus Aminicenantes bacterium]|nr:hypothetical protein [Candidatus Aminicenantes bacterium]